MSDLVVISEIGPQGATGTAATVQVGSVTASAPGANPAVTNSGSSAAAVFDFVIPRGATGPEGPAGSNDWSEITNKPTLGTAAALNAGQSSGNLLQLTGTGAVTLGLATITGTSAGSPGLSLAANGAGHRDINLTPAGEGNVFLASPTQMGAGRGLRIGGVPVTGTLITGRGGKAWGWTTGGGPFTALSGIYAGQSECDSTTTWGYNPTSGAANDDVQWGMGLETRYLNASSDLSSEYYLYWKSALHGANLYMDRRPVQVNVAHEDTGDAARAFQVDWTWSAESFQVLGSSIRTATTTGGTLNNDRYFRVLFAGTDHRVETSGTLNAAGGLISGAALSAPITGVEHNVGSFQAQAGGEVFGFSASQANGELQIKAGTSSLAFWRGAVATERLVIGAAASGAAFGASTTNAFLIDAVGSNAGTTRPLLVRRSSDGGSTYTTTATFNASGRVLFGTLSDTGTANEVIQVAGAIVSRQSVGGTSFRAAEDGYGYDGFNVRSDTSGGWGITTRRGSAEALQIGSARGGSGASTMWGGLNNTHAVASIAASAGNRRPIIFNSSSDSGATFTSLVTFDFVNSRINLASGVVYSVNGDQVIGPRETGWTAATGTAAKGAYATFSAPVISGTYTAAEVQSMADAIQAASRRIKALEDSLRTHGLIN